MNPDNNIDMKMNTKHSEMTKTPKKTSFLQWIKKHNKSNENNNPLSLHQQHQRPSLSVLGRPKLIMKIKPKLKQARSLDEPIRKTSNCNKSKKCDKHQCHTELSKSSVSYAKWMKLHQDNCDSDKMAVEASSKCVNNDECRPCKRISFIMQYYQQFVHSELDHLTVNVTDDSLSTFMDGLPGYSHIQLSRDYRHLQIFHRIKNGQKSYNHHHNVHNKADKVDYTNTLSLIKHIYVSLAKYNIYHDVEREQEQKTSMKQRRKGLQKKKETKLNPLTEVSKLMMDLKTKKDFNSKYMKLGMIAQGANGKIFAVKTWKDNKFYAMKEISFAKLNINILYEVLRNWKMVQNLQLIDENTEMYVDSNKSTLLIVVHLYKGSSCELLKEIYSAKQRFLNEIELKRVLKNGVLPTLQTLHSNGYIHGDIKPENIVFEYKDRDKEQISTAVVDYDLCIKLKEQSDGTYSEWRGTLGYSGPEWSPYRGVRSFIDTKVDIYALGLTMLILLCGEQPFLCPTAVKQKLKQQNPSLNIKQFVYEAIMNKGEVMVSNFLNQLRSKFSDDLCDLLEAMLQFEPQNRLDIDQVIQHKWFNDDHEVKE